MIGPRRVYMEQLDGVRAVAVVMVIVSHWARGFTPPFWFSGGVGVALFFALSGFLITGLLLDARAEAEGAGVGRAPVLRSFYARRFLRIFPLYYATLAGAVLLGFAAVRDALPWHAFYLSNVYFAMWGTWFDEASHFWSLAVEEQFYLVWPWVVLFLPRRALLPAMVGVVAVGPTFRLLGYHAFGWNEVTATVLPLAALDALGLGALFALLSREAYRPRRLGSARGLAAALGVGGAVVWAWGATYGLPLPPLAAEFLTGFAERAALLGVVAGAASGFGGPVGWALSLPPVVYVGRVSYGLYLLHLFVPTMTVRVLRHVAWTPPVALEWVGEAAVLLAACALSWHFFERPINALKRHFPYVPRAAAPAEAAATAEPVRVPSL